MHRRRISSKEREQTNLQDMAMKGIIVKHGIGRGIYYTLHEAKNEAKKADSENKG